MRAVELKDDVDGGPKIKKNCYPEIARRIYSLSSFSYPKQKPDDHDLIADGDKTFSSGIQGRKTQCRNTIDADSIGTVYLVNFGGGLCLAVDIGDDNYEDEAETMGYNQFV